MAGWPERPERTRTLKALTVSLIVLLAILHQDFWWWDDPTPVLGVLPVGLAWHILISLLSGLAWWLATRSCWPEELGEADGLEESGNRQEQAE